MLVLTDNQQVLIAGRLALIALVIGVSVGVAATETITMSLVVSGALAWSFVPVLHLLTGLMLVGRPTSVSVREGLERYVDLHWPWSLWILAAAALLLVVPAARGYAEWLILTAAVPVIWTVRLLLAYGRDVLGLPLAQARRRVAVHQIVTYAVAFMYIVTAVALWPRIVGLFT
ncbi:MAG TPA: hypothetical protein VJ813_12970 [Vicinamibacterales bacterium]|nr:hypothetical protein [Vicinamibacterales bacterium]